MNKPPLVSLVILNWNGKRWLKQCLPTVKKINYPSLEVVIVNNGSTDDSVDFLKKYYPTIKVVEIKKNRGYAGANNLGVKATKGKYVLLMNNDTKVTPSFLNKLVEDMENDPRLGAVQPQMRSMIYPKLLDSVGSFLTFTGFMYHFGYMKPHAKKMYQKPLYAYSIKGACFLMRRKDYLDLGGLDEDFVCYVEETDLCHRIWLSGKKVLYEPRSIMYHWGGGDMQVMTKDEVTIFRSFRNRFISYTKNLSIRELILLLPSHIIFCELFILASLLTGKIKKAGAAQLGMIASLYMLPKTLKKRKHIQHHIRKVSDSEIAPFIKRNPRLSYYFYLFQDIKRYKD